ncbi:hypothetical protein K488DRAFT_86085 [Vararia minispora EC-137]|uniref:Uncharacterized protein n=1 Tax=Vararia minispora EC-137 TaxID=1314806 RepID=A0ACB8QKN6_9AGAM|nr:hypothetical protein K488DRAFT_86085 [Vararia minispora EC-137]
MVCTSQLPYLTYGLHTVALYTLTAKYISGLNASSLLSVGPSPAPDAFSMDLDTTLSPSERASCVAWDAHIQNAIGCLLRGIMYSSRYRKIMPPSFIQRSRAYTLSLSATMFPYRLRALQIPRLDASGFWNLAGQEIEDVQAEKQQEKFPHDGKKQAPPAARPR